MTLSTRSQVIIGSLLIALMLITRGHHFATIDHLPSASWAVFFLAGFYLSSKWMFPLLLTQAAFMDFAVTTWGGISSFCVSPAYPLLIPAYGILWLGGRWYTEHYKFDFKTLMPLSSSIFVATAVSTVISNGGFYFFSGRYAEPTLIEFGHRFIKYYPSSLSNLAFYIAIAMIFHIIVISLMSITTKQSGQQS